jgi:hypothetical protein
MEERYELSCALSLAIASTESYLYRGFNVNCSVLQRHLGSPVCLIFDFKSLLRPAKSVCFFAHWCTCSACHTGPRGTPFMAMGPTCVATGLSLSSGEKIPLGFLRCLVERSKSAEEQYRQTIRGSWTRAGSFAPGRRPQSRAEHQSSLPNRT